MKKTKFIEALVGVGLGVLIYLFVAGYNILPLVTLIGLGGLLYLFMEQRGILQTSTLVNSAPKVEFSFDNIGGQNMAKQELKEALEFILQAEQVKKMGIRPLRGILLTGPPGTGKTLLAKAAASYTNSVYIAVSGSEFIEVYAGVGAQRVRNLFRSARDTARKQGKNSAIIFIDEIEVLGGKRGSHASHLEYDQTLNQLLVEMDGISVDDYPRVLVIGATNRMDLLDPALLRPGRFDRQVRVELPDRADRLEILQLHCRNKPLAENINLDQIAREAFGFSGAHLESLANEAAVLALRQNSSLITQEHLREAIEKVIMGEKLDRQPSKQEIERVAVHEAGHAVISELVRPNSVARVTITPRGSALGYVRRMPEQDQYLYTRSFLEKQIMICLGGAMAEELLLGERSTGAASDFEEAIRMAKQIISSGISHLGVVCLESISQENLNQAIKVIINFQEQLVRQLIMSFQDCTRIIARLLVENETVPGEQLRQYLSWQNRLGA
ncbi:MAG: AAA family ATPase [Syntrophomonadaceae bacterium]|nr:AAA family ATPase [Syntrophomonadaceae bacterium]